MNIHFNHPLALLGLAAVAVFVFAILRTYNARGFRFSRGRTALAISLTVYAFAGAMAVFGLAGMTRTVAVHTIELTGHKVINLVDESGSQSSIFNIDPMVIATHPNLQGVEGSEYAATRNAFVEFAGRRALDEIGVTMFSDEVRVLNKFGTNSNSESIRQLQSATPVFAGTNLLPALRSVISQFAADVGGKNRVLILTTDGEDELKPEDVSSVSDELNKLDVHVYWVKAVLTSYTDMYENKLDLQKILDSVRGMKFIAKTDAELAGAYERIGQLEPAVVQPTTVLATDSLSLPLYFSAYLLAVFATLLLIHRVGAPRTRVSTRRKG